ncbi:hypothetical protein ABPG72_012275 [Tetrahymena utriculariae]
MAQEEITFYQLDEFLSSSFLSHKNIRIEYSENNIGNKNVQNLGLALKSLKNLSNLYLCLNSNQIESEGIMGFSSAFQYCTSIIDFTLTLSSNPYQSKALVGFGSSLSRGKFQNLYLYIGWNQIDKDDIIDFGYKIANCTQMKQFHLSITGANMKSETASGLISALFYCKHLQNLYICLSYNNIDEISKIGSSLTKFSHILTLHLDLNNNPIYSGQIKLQKKVLKMKRLVKRTLLFF